ncbi:hypothetical protein KI387_001633 [Taxus chinensis]|uniref:Glycine-rich protein n=1 Tax=Taxus chinensis TaxID=29808 RepID=A0AA38LP30_TAXCH|nr:hypothetical protein KI387_001633 [Taxus chinensis]
MAGSEAAAPDGSVNSSLSALVKDGPVLSMLNKRLRSLKKKFNRILQIEESISQGKVINKEQEDVLKSKLTVSILIDEYEKLKQPLAVAVKEELAEREKELLLLSEDNNENENENENEIETPANDVAAAAEEEEENKETGVDENRTVDSLETRQVEEEASCGDAKDDSIAEVLKIMYFGHLFNVIPQSDFGPMMWTKMHERSSCLSYDYVTDDTTKPLREEDLDALSLFGSLITSRPPNATLSHKSALENCLHHARHWLLNSDNTILPDVSVSYSDLRERLNRILSSEYFTMTPELQTVSQQTAAAAATAVGQYVTQALAHENSAEGYMYQTEATTVYYQPEDQSGEEHKLYQTEEYNVTPAGAEHPSDSVEELNPAARYDTQNETSFEVAQSDADQIPTNLIPTVEQQESHTEHLLSESQVPQQKQQPPVQLGHQQLDLDLKANQQQLEHEHRDNQQHSQYHSQNGGPSRVYQGQRGGRGMGYGVGRGRGFMNGRGGRFGRGGGYSNGRGQYYEQGNYYRRNYNNGRGRGRKSAEMMYDSHAAGSSQDTVATQTN